MSGGGLEGASDLVISCCCIVLFRVEEDSNKSNEFHKTARFPCFPFLEILRIARSLSQLRRRSLDFKVLSLAFFLFLSLFPFLSFLFFFCQIILTI